MATITLQTALKLLRYNHAEPEVRDILQAVLDELDRLYAVEALARDMASAGKDGLIDVTAVEAVWKLIKAQ